MSEEPPAYAPGAWRALGMFIVGPTVVAALLMAWGYLLYRVVKLFGGDPTNDTFGVWIFISFAFLGPAASPRVDEAPIDAEQQSRRGHVSQGVYRDVGPRGTLVAHQRPKNLTNQRYKTRASV